ncbi:MAG: ATP-binding protein [Fermentimonas sp.]|nr:ATP-binding protein [Fermentimonas sp.]MDD3188093.1 ATP-binding protein [Fermentimonas sp.]MDD3511069.1 ATP-binding protein [Fermentimonas sp.]MDD4723614.1 ATP-binding protein [Fermentimonas sp.]NLZ72541.1 P-loop NTPase [Bacteroidales bacterium]
MKIAIASGKGGTGKTFISTNLFHTLQLQGENVTLVDCDAEEPNASAFIKGKLLESYPVIQLVPVIDETKCTYCGKCSEYCNYNAIFFLEERKIIKVTEELCHGCGACSFVCSYDAISEKEDTLGEINRFGVSSHSELVEARMKVGVYSPVSVLKEAIKAAGDAPIVLMDSPPGTSCPFIQTVDKADFVVLVTEPTPFGLSDLRQSVEVLKTMNKPFGVIINRADMGGEGVYQYLHKENITHLMSIPFKRDIAAVYSKGELLCEEQPSWQQSFSSLFNQIKDLYGDSCH